MATNGIIAIQKILEGRDPEFDKANPEKEIKFIRHSGNPHEGDPIWGEPIPTDISSMTDLYLYRKDLFDKYSGEQRELNFRNVKYMVVLLGEEGKGATSRFVGVYKVCGSRPSPFSYKKGHTDARLYDLQKVEAFAALEEKIIVDWGKSQNWHQYYSNEKDVVRIDNGLRDADGIPFFKSYYEVILSHDELHKIISSQNPEWKSKLEAVHCIYLIQDKSNGKQYVGSTYSSDGIWGRWSEYAKNGHGNNTKLEELVKANPNYHKQYFQWSILETLPIHITSDEAIAKESIWKKKLLSRKFGYNKN